MANMTIRNLPDHVHALLWFDDDTGLPEAIKVWKAGSSHWLIKLYQETSPELLEELTVQRERPGSCQFLAEAVL